MQQKLTQRVTLALAAMALFVAAGGPAYASSKISGSKIKKNSISENRLTKSAQKSLKGNAGPAGPQGPLGPQGIPGPVNAIFAHLDASGTSDPGISDSSGVVSVDRANTGSYDITANRSLTGCTPTATVSAAANGFATNYISIAQSTTPNTVHVQEIDTAGNPVDSRDFNVLILC